MIEINVNYLLTELTFNKSLDAAYSLDRHRVIGALTINLSRHGPLNRLEFSNCEFDRIIIEGSDSQRPINIIFKECKFLEGVTLSQCVVDKASFLTCHVEAGYELCIDNSLIKSLLLKSVKTFDTLQITRSLIYETNISSGSYHVIKIDDFQRGFIPEKAPNLWFDRLLEEINLSDVECDKLVIAFKDIYSIEINQGLIKSVSLEQCSLDLIEVKFTEMDIHEVTMDNVFVKDRLGMLYSGIEKLNITNCNFNNDDQTQFEFIKSYVKTLHNTLTSWPKNVIGTPRDKVNGNRFLKGIAEQSKDDFRYSHYRFKEHVNQARMLWHQKGVLSKLAYFNLRIPQWINYGVSNNGQSVLGPIAWLLGVHVLLTLWMISVQGFDTTWSEKVNLYAFTILPTHRLEWGGFQLCPSISLLMRICSGLFIYHIVWASRKMNRGS